MRAPIPTLVICGFLLHACTDQGGMANAQAPVGGITTAWKEGADYTVLERVRFMDNRGFQQPAEAFSALIPKGWKHEGGVVWKSLQECRADMVGAQFRV